MSSDIPNSPDELIRLAEQAANAADPPVTTRMPRFSLSMKQDNPSGPLDFTAIVDQVILASRGVPAVQLLHAASYLVTSATRSMLAALQDGQEEPPPGALFRALSDIGQLEHCVATLNAIVSLPTSFHVAEQLEPDEPTEQRLQRCMVSRRTIDDLGLDADAFDRYFFSLVKVSAYGKRRPQDN